MSRVSESSESSGRVSRVSESSDVRKKKPWTGQKSCQGGLGAPQTLFLSHAAGGPLREKKPERREQREQKFPGSPLVPPGPQKSSRADFRNSKSGQVENA